MLEDPRGCESQDGWGITHSGGRDTDLIISDGTSRLTVVDHETLEKISSVEVMQGLQPMSLSGPALGTV